MTRLKNVFAVSFIAMFAVAGAHATIVTQENIVGANGVSVNVPASGQTNAGKVVVTGPTIGNATLTIQKNGTNVDTFTANATSNKTINIQVSKSDVGLSNVNNTSDANKPISNATQAALDGKQDANLVDYVSGDAYANMKTGYAEMTDSYPSVATVGTWIQDKTDTLGGQMAGKQEILLSSGDGANVSVTGNGNVITAVSAPGDGSITFNKGTTLGSLATKSAVGSSEITDDSIVNADVKSNAAISTAKLAIPSGWTNTQSATALAAGDTVSAALGKLEKKVDSKQASGSYEASGTAAGLINGLDVSTSSGDGNVVTAVTQTDGKISVTKGTTLGSLATKSAVGSSEITDDSIVNADVKSNAAISTAKLAIPSGWTNTQSATALAAGDTVSAALGKLEKKVDSKQASGSYEASGTAAGLINGLDVSTSSGDGNVVTAVTQTDGKISVTKGTTLGSLATKNSVASSDITDKTIVNADISDNAAIAQSKINGLVDDLAGKQDANLVDYVSGDDYAAMKTGYVEMTEEYPSVATVGTWLNDLSNNLGGTIGDKQNILVSSGTGANVTFSGSGNVVSNISATGGTVTVTKSRVQIPSGSETASSYASIWIE